MMEAGEESGHEEKNVPWSLALLAAHHLVIYGLIVNTVIIFMIIAREPREGQLTRTRGVRIKNRVSRSTVSIVS